MVHILNDLTLTGSAQVLTSTPTKCNWVSVQGVGSNAVARIGDSTVTTTRGGIIAANQGFFFFPPVTDNNGYDLSLIYVIGSNGDTVSIIYNIR